MKVRCLDPGTPRRQSALETEVTAGPGPSSTHQTGQPGTWALASQLQDWVPSAEGCRQMKQKMVEEAWQSPGAPGRPGHHILEDLQPTRNPWSPKDGVVLPQAGAKSRIQTLDPRMARLVGCTLPHLSDRITWKAQRGAVSHPHSHSTCMCVTVPNKNPVTPGLPVTPPKGLLVPADLPLSRLPGLYILVSQKREGKLVRRGLLPAPQLRTFSPLPSQLSTPCPPPHTLL